MWRCLSGNNDIWCGLIPSDNGPITQQELDNVYAMQLSNAGAVINYGKINVTKVYILEEFPSLSMSDGQVWTDDIVELYLMERIFWTDGFYMMGEDSLRYDDHMNSQLRCYTSTGEVLDTSNLGLLLAEQIETPSCIYGMHRPKYDVYSIIGKDSTYLAVYSVDDQEYKLFEEYDPSEIVWTEPAPVKQEMEGEILLSVYNNPAICEDYFYFTWYSRRYRVYYSDMDGLYEGQKVRITYMSDTHKKLDDADGRFGINYEITALKVEPILNIGEIDSLIYFRIFEEPNFLPNAEMSYQDYAAPVTSEEKNILLGLVNDRLWLDTALVSSNLTPYGIVNVVTDDGWNIIALCEDGILTKQGYSAFSSEEYALIAELKNRLTHSNEARNYFTDDYLVYQQKTKQ